MKALSNCLTLLFATLLTVEIAAQEKGINNQFPSFKTESTDGQSFSHKSLQGKVTLINFWFEACVPCVAEFDALNTIYAQFKDHSDFQFISFTFDPKVSVNESITKHRLLFPVCAISIDESSRLNPSKLYPANVVVDQTGTIVFLKTGGKKYKEDVAEDLQPLGELIARLLAGGS